MKSVMKKAMSVMLLLALTVTLNAGFIGTIPRTGGGISPMSDMPGPTDFQF